MNKKSRKLTALVLSAALGLSGLGLAFAQTGSQPQQTADAAEPAATTGTATQSVNEKDETVYVLANADGSVQRIIVSDWLKNALGSDSIADRSELESIENVRGNESCRSDGEDGLLWDAQGSDIYYQGDSSRELPVELRVSYRLDGQAISPEELAGQSGRVSIRFDYENRLTRTVDVGGQQEELYVPFAVLTGLLLDNDTFRNVEVSNGKLINDGERSIVAGLAFPGLREDLGLSREQLDIPDYVEVCADVTDFSLGMTVTLVSSEPFRALEDPQLDTSAATDALGQLTEAMEQLLDGSSALYEGLCTLLEESGGLLDGAEQLAQGAGALYEGAGDLTEGAGQLQSGLTELRGGLDTLSGSSAALNEGAEQVFDTLLSAAAQQLEAAGLTVPELSPDSYAQVLSQLIASLDEENIYQQALQQVTAAVEARRGEITEQVTAAVRAQVTEQVTAAVKAQVTEQVTAAVQEQVTEQVLAAMGLSRESYEAALAAGQLTPEQQAAIEAAIARQMASDEVQGLIEQNVSAQLESDTVQATVAAQTEQQLQTESVQSLIGENVEAQVQQAIARAMASDEVQQQLAAASEGAQSVMALKTSLDSYQAFYLGLRSYTDGVDAAADGAARLESGAATLTEGAAQLREGSGSLYEGTLTLRDSLPALTDGIRQLRDGALSLSDGLEQLNREGLQKLVELVDEDLDGLVERLQATLELAREYRSFSGIGDMDGQVRFLYRTDEICRD